MRLDSGVVSGSVIPGQYDSLIAKLNSEPFGEPDAVLFNVYRFYREYLWSVPGEPEYCAHYHVSNETLAEFRAGRGELYAVLHVQEG